MVETYGYSIDELKSIAASGGNNTPNIDTMGYSIDELKAIAGKVQPKQPPQEIGGMRSFGLGVGQGATLGLGDEAVAALAAIPSSIYTGNNYLDEYRANKQIQQDVLNRAQEQHGGAYLAGNLAGGAPLPFAGGNTMRGLALAGGATGLVSGAGTSQKDITQDPYGVASDAAIGGLVGAVAAPALGGIANKLFGKPVEAVKNAATNYVDNVATGGQPSQALNVTVNAPDNMQAVRETFSSLADESKKVFDDAITKGATPEQAQAMALAKQYNLPLSKGQILQNVDTQRLEGQALTGVLGEEPYKIAKGFQQVQQGRIGEITQDLATRVGGGQSPMNEADIGENIINQVKQSYKAEKGIKSAPFEVIKGMTASVDKKYITEFNKSLSSQLESEGYDIKSMPAINNLLKGFETALKDNKAPDVTINTINNLRKRANNANIATPTEGNALRLITKSFNALEDDLIEQNLIMGDERALEMLKTARPAYREFMQKYFGEGNQLNPKKVVGRIAVKEMSPNEAIGLTLGQGIIGKSPAIVKEFKDVLGADSPAFNQLKQAHVLRLMNITPEKLVDSDLANSFSGTVFAKNYRNLMTKNKSFAQELYTPQELTELRNVANLMLRTTRKEAGAINYSNSANAMLAFLNKMSGKVPLGNLGSGVVQKGLSIAKEAKDTREVQRAFSRELKNILQQTSSVDSEFTKKLVGGRAASTIPQYTSERTTELTVTKGKKQE